MKLLLTILLVALVCIAGCSNNPVTSHTTFISPMEKSVVFELANEYLLANGPSLNSHYRTFCIGGSCLEQYFEFVTIEYRSLNIIKGPVRNNSFEVGCEVSGEAMYRFEAADGWRSFRLLRNFLIKFIQTEDGNWEIVRGQLWLVE